MSLRGPGMMGHRRMDWERAAEAVNADRCLRASWSRVAVAGPVSSANYLAMPTIWSTAAFTSSSDRSARPPLAGITPELPWKPLRAWS